MDDPNEMPAHKIPLLDLKPEWIKESDVITGLSFDCPKCWPHRITIIFGGKSDTGFEYQKAGSELTHVTVAPSIKHHKDGCHFSGYIISGTLFHHREYHP